MKIYKKEITVYDFEGIFDGFCVEAQTELVGEEEAICFYLYHKAYGIKSLMFGLLKKDIESENYIRDIIAANIEADIELYREDFMDQ